MSALALVQRLVAADDLLQLVDLAEQLDDSGPGDHEAAGLVGVAQVEIECLGALLQRLGLGVTGLPALPCLGLGLILPPSALPVLGHGVGVSTGDGAEALDQIEVDAALTVVGVGGRLEIG